MKPFCFSQQRRLNICGGVGADRGVPAFQYQSGQWSLAWGNEIQHTLASSITAENEHAASGEIKLGSVDEAENKRGEG